MSIEMEFDPQAEAERARTEAQEALARARHLIEQSRTFFLNPSAEPDFVGIAPLSHQGEPPPAGEAAETVILRDEVDAKLPPADLPRLSA